MLTREREGNIWARARVLCAGTRGISAFPLLPRTTTEQISGLSDARRGDAQRSLLGRRCAPRRAPGPCASHQAHSCLRTDLFLSPSSWEPPTCPLFCQLPFLAPFLKNCVQPGCSGQLKAAKVWEFLCGV